VWGLLRSAAQELPGLRLRRLLLEGDVPLAFPVLPGEYVIRQDGLYVPRLQAIRVPKAVDVPPTYSRALVTGGLRGLGVKVAEWLLETKRASELVLMGRNPPQGDNAALIQRLERDFAVTIKVFIGDVSKWANLEKLPECDLVVHVAGNVKDGFLLNATEADIQKVLRPKIRGAVHIKKRFPKARSIGFSSSSGVFGVAGQATYSAANIFLDAMMPTIQWGGWGEVGMASDLNIQPGPGERFFPVSVGLECLGRLLDGPERTRPALALDVDWDVYRLNSDAFSAEDSLLANIDAVQAPPSFLGEPAMQVEGFARSWELILGPVGSRFRGSCPVWEVCMQHVIDETPVFPGTGFIALALEAARECGVAQALLINVAWLRPLELSAPRKLTTAIVERNEDSNGSTVRFSSRALRPNGEEDHEAPVVLHCTCSFASAAKQQPMAFSTSTEAMEAVTDLYDRFASVGFNYGPQFRAAAVACTADKTNALCQFVEFKDTFAQVHPALLDTAMHLVALLHPSGLSGVPHKVQRLEIFKDSKPISARARMVNEDTIIQLLDQRGDVVCSMEGLELTPLTVPPTLHLQQRSWQDAPPEPRGTWLLHDTETIQKLGSLQQVTTDHLESHDAVLLAVQAETLEDMRRSTETARTLAASGPCWIASLPAKFAEAAAAAAVEVGAQAVIGTPQDICTASAGLGLKAPIVRAKDGKLQIQTLEDAPTTSPETAGPMDAFVVTTDPAQGAKGAKCQWSRRREPAAHEVELKTSVWALNFRDVLVAVGAIPSEVAGQSLGIGGECYGEVVRVGADVQGLAVGDRVIGCPPDGMGSFATFDARWVGLAPSNMTPQEAVSGTMVYATAWLGLKWMARMSKGERVLIHSAAGGVGLSAVHLCLRAGCTVYVTASTQEKRDMLLSLGATAAFDSRNVSAFEEGIRAETNGEGVDIVLNSLSGDAISASLQLLSPFGRFIEIGKRDQYEGTRIGLDPFLNGITYAAAHLDVLMLRQPDRCRKLLCEVWDVMSDLPKLPATNFMINELPKALEYFSKGVHIGKVLVSIGDDTLVHAACPAEVRGPQGDAFTQALRQKLRAGSLPGGVVCLPRLCNLEKESDLHGAQVVLTTSHAVAELASVLEPKSLCIQIPRWEPVASLNGWLGLHGCFVATEEEKAGNLQEWLMQVVGEMAGEIGVDQTFESVGLDSLALISLARRLSSKVGKTVSVVDLYDNPTPQQLLDALGGGSPQAELVRSKVVVLHGYRTNREIMNLTCAPYVSAVGSVQWLFVNSPRRARGRGHEKIPDEMEVYEWYGRESGDYGTGWMDPDGLEETLPIVKALKPLGIVGFSQGGAIASLVESAWLATFSPVFPPGLKARDTPSFHAYDPNEEFVSHCLQVLDNFSNKEVYTHNEGHNVPQDANIVRAFAAWVAKQPPK
jgi:NADPH:quinone reductase-like Zn-dependent oxidoreductase/aryl carrier-like protein